MDLSDRYCGCLLGLAAGDAVGTTVEFRPRGSFEPLTGMVGGGPFRLLPGQWTDDTSMALCLSASLVERGGFDAADQMARYCRWRDQGHMSSNGRCFDIGDTVASALTRYQRTGDPFAGSTDPRSAGNGCIMRLAPIPMFFFPDLELAEHYAVESSRTTHAAAECLDASRLFARMLLRALQGASKAEILLGDQAAFVGAPKIMSIAQGGYIAKPATAIRGSGYVVESLEAALWCFYHTDSFEQAILAAANLGDDADTTAAVCGQAAGAFYSATGIPAQWLEPLALRAEIEDMAGQLYQMRRA